MTSRWIVAVLILASFTSTYASDSCGKIKHVLLTSFEPFDGRADNGSDLAAQFLFRQNDPCIVYHSCLLPVVYERSAQAAKTCFEQMSPIPDAVVSLGEAQCDLRVETKAHNLNDVPGFPDNDHQVREGQPIEIDSKGDVLFSFPTASLYCGSHVPVGPATRPSVTPGFFVCNDLAYRLARFLKPRQVPFTFIHVPTTSCPGICPEDTAQKIHEMIGIAFWSMGLTDTVFRAKLGTHPFPATARPVTPQCVNQFKRELRIREWERTH